MLEDKKYEKLRLKFLADNKKFEELEDCDIDLLEEIREIAINEYNERLSKEIDYDDLYPSEEEEERQYISELKCFYYNFCLEAKQNPDKVSMFISHYKYDINVNMSIQKTRAICMNESSDEERIKTFSDKIKSIENKIISMVDFGDDWADFGKPGINDVNILAKWVDDNDDFYLFIQLLLVIDKLKYYKKELSDKIQKEENENKNKQVFLFNLYPKKELILNALEDLQITVGNKSILTSRRLSLLRGFVEGCIDRNILPPLPLRTLYEQIADYIGLKLNKPLQSTDIGNAMKKKTINYLKEKLEEK